MTLDYTKYNVIMTEEGFIGLKKDMIKLYGDYAKDLIEDTEFETLKEVADLLIKLDNIKENLLVYVYYPYNEFCVEIVSKRNYY